MLSVSSKSVIFMSRLLRNWNHVGYTTHYIEDKSLSRSYAFSPHENDQSMKRLKQFLEREKNVIAKLKNDFAEPYVDLDSVVEYVAKNGKHKPSTNDLYNCACQHSLHRPAIDMKFILENKEMVAENLKNRKLPRVILDLSKDIIAPYEKLLAIRKQKTEWEDRKKAINMWMKDYWTNKKNQVDPQEAEKMRDESINLGCLITLLTRIDTELEKLFYEKVLLLPNMTHPDVPMGIETDVKVLKTVGEKTPSQGSYGHMEVGERTGIIHQKHISNFTGHRSYFLCDDAADLEQALVRFTLDRLRTKGFRMISGPNVLHGSMFEACGMASTKINDMLYKIVQEQEENFYISGTSEVTIASFLANHAISIKDLPMKFCCVSTCCRKETDNRRDPRGLYRVHHFTKVEMFGVTANETGQESAELFQEFLQTQEELFSDLGIHFRIVNMPTGDLGLPAYQKIDMEAWMPGRDSYGEISSTSNCTDFQSRRLHILYKQSDDYKFAHTINGTACAVPRMIIALCENNQTQEKTIVLPEVLHPYLKRTFIKKSTYKRMEYIGPNQSRKKWRMPKE